MNRRYAPTKAPPNLARELIILHGFVQSNRPGLVVLATLSATSAGAALLVLNYINRIAASPSHGRVVSALLVGLAWLSLLFTVNAASQYISASLGARLVAQLRTELSRAFLTASYEKLVHEENPLLGIFIQDIGAIGPLALILPPVAYNMFMVLGCTCYLFYISPIMSAAMLSGLLPMAVLSWFHIGSTYKYFDLLRQSENIVFDHVQAIRSGKKELSLYDTRKSHFFAKLLQPAIAAAETAMAKAHLRLGLHQSWSSSMLYIIIFIIAYTGYVTKFPIKTMLSFLVGFFFLMGPLGFLVNINQQIARGISSLRNIEQLGLEFVAPTQIGLTARRVDKELTAWRHILADEVCYRYPTQAETDSGLGPISLNLWRGETLFITGANGSGKTSLLLILCSLLTPQSGRLLIDGVLASEDQQSYRRLFSGVFGDFYLFKHLLNDAGESPSDEESAALLDRLELAKEVQVEDGELSRVTLSTGQRKRAALLQSLIQDREIYIFDEWAADQDPAFKRYFYQVMLSELKARGKTIVVISHDDRYFAVADRVIKLEDGCIVSETPHVRGAL